MIDKPKELLDWPKVNNHNNFMVSVLLIDDDGFREEIRIGLERAGFRVTAVESGNNGIKIFKQNPHDVIITDVVMDRGEGIETMNRLHDLDPGVPGIRRT